MFSILDCMLVLRWLDCRSLFSMTHETLQSFRVLIYIHFALQNLIFFGKSLILYVQVNVGAISHSIHRYQPVQPLISTLNLEYSILLHYHDECKRYLLDYVLLSMTLKSQYYKIDREIIQCILIDTCHNLQK